MANMFPVFIMVMAMLVACSSPEERAEKRSQKEIAACMAQGIEPETEAFEECRLQVRAAEQKRLEERMRWGEEADRPGSSHRIYRW